MTKSTLAPTMITVEETLSLLTQAGMETTKALVADLDWPGLATRLPVVREMAGSEFAGDEEKSALAALEGLVAQRAPALASAI